MRSHEFISFIFLALSIFSTVQVFAQAKSVIDRSIEPSSPFSIALETLQNHIGYDFQSIGLLRRAMTHPSFSEESNKALSILGANVIETSVSLQSLTKNLDISSKDLNRLISEMSNVESSCAIC